MSIPEAIINRKGARKIAEIPAEVMQLLNSGMLETANLTEWLAIDQLTLLKTVLESLGKSDWFAQFEAAVNRQKKPTANSNTREIGMLFGTLLDEKSTVASLQSHPSDVVRCWACWSISLQHDDILALLTAMKPFAADTHFGVREVVIFATKDRLVLNLDLAINILKKWAVDDNENVRRYAAEALRPVGVWVKKIAAFQDDPSRGLPVLEPLKSDSSRYVQNAVANWLNDASKSKPEWVQATCNEWLKQSSSKETAYIVKRALRTINK